MCHHAAVSLAEVETATLRLVALRTSRTMNVDAARLEMAPAPLSRRVGRRRRPPPPMAREAERSERPRVEVHRATPTLAEIWRSRVLDMLEEPQREGLAPPFEFGDANIRNGAKEWLARIKSGPASLASREAIAGLESLLADLNARMSPADPGSDKPR